MKIENINSSKFQALTNEQLNEINGGRQYKWSDRYTVADPHDSSKTKYAYDLYSAPEIFGVRCWSWKLESTTYTGAD